MATPQIEDGHTRISNELLDALCRIRIPGRARQMLDAIIRKTYGWGKSVDEIATSQFVTLTGLKPYEIHKSRKKLQEMNIITVTQKGYGKVLSYSLQKDYDKWRVLPKRVTVTLNGNNCNPKGLRSVTQKVVYNRKKETIQKKEKPSPIGDVVGFLNRISNSNFKPTTSSTIRLINARLKEGFTPDQLKAVTQKKVNDWLNDPVMCKYLRPETLYGTKFEGYLEELKKADIKGRSESCKTFR